MRLGAVARLSSRARLDEGADAVGAVVATAGLTLFST
jgi:hypothetical protein